MSVAVACTLSEGVILGVDSAVTLQGPEGHVGKIYENAQKLFQLGELPVGLAAFGMAAFGTRSIGSFISEFETTHPGLVSGEGAKMADVVEALRVFFSDVYKKEVVPKLEQEVGKPYKDIPADNLPALGFAVGGFSHGAYLPELWTIVVPKHKRKGSAELRRKEGDFGTNWFAMFDPIRRYIKGYDPSLMNDLGQFFFRLLGRQATKEETEEMQAILNKHEYQIPFAAMPLSEGVAHTRFLVELVINHHRFAMGAPVVGGRVKLGKVTYRGGKFQLLDEEDIYASDRASN